MADHRFENNGSLEQLLRGGKGSDVAIIKTSIADGKRKDVSTMRPSWDEYFMDLG